MMYNLNGHKSAQCRVYVEDNGIFLQSYYTTVCSIDEYGFVGCMWNYSATTRKHIGWFLKEYAPNLRYCDMKIAIESHVVINKDTLDVMDIYTSEILGNMHDEPLNIIAKRSHMRNL